MLDLGAEKLKWTGDAYRDNASNDVSFEEMLDIHAFENLTGRVGKPQLTKCRGYRAGE